MKEAIKEFDKKFKMKLSGGGASIDGNKIVLAYPSLRVRTRIDIAVLDQGEEGVDSAVALLKEAIAAYARV